MTEEERKYYGEIAQRAFGVAERAGMSHVIAWRAAAEAVCNAPVYVDSVQELAKHFERAFNATRHDRDGWMDVARAAIARGAK